MSVHGALNAIILPRVRLVREEGWVHFISTRFWGEPLG